MPASILNSVSEFGRSFFRLFFVTLWASCYQQQTRHVIYKKKIEIIRFLLIAHIIIFSTLERSNSYVGNYGTTDNSTTRVLRPHRDTRTHHTAGLHRRFCPVQSYFYVSLATDVEVGGREGGREREVTGEAYSRTGYTIWGTVRIVHRA